MEAVEPQVAGRRADEQPVLGPLPCIACQRLVVWRRVGGLLRLMNAKGHGGRQAHRCAA